MKTKWQVKKLGEVANIYGGGTPPTSHAEYFQGNTNWFTPTELPVDNVGTISVSNRMISEQAEQFTTVSGAGTILLSSRATIGNVAILSNASGYNQGIKGIEPNRDVINNWYLAYWLKANKEKLFLKSFGTTFKEISTSSVKDLEITIPTINQQKKIVERLDAVRKAQELCDQQIQKTEVLFESILETETISDFVNIHELSFFTEKVTYGFTNPMPTSNEGPYMVTARDITEDEVNYNSCRKTTLDAYNKLITDKSRPELGDILLTKDGTLGRIALVTTVPLCINQSVALIKPNKTKVIPQYLRLLLGSSKYQRIMKANAGGAIIKHIYITTIDKMKIAVPSLKEQQRIVEKLEAVQNYKKLLQKEKALLKELFDSVLDKSMKGELDN